MKESLVLQPRPDESRRFGLGPVRSPLLGPSRLLSFPRGTEMFQFPPFAPAAYGLGGGSFGHPGLNAWLTAPPGLSQSSTPFIAYRRQDIPHMPLVAWPRRPCPRRCGEPGRRCCSTGPLGAGVTILLSNQGSCRDSHRPGPNGTPLEPGCVNCNSYRIPNCQRTNHLASRRSNPIGFRNPLH